MNRWSVRFDYLALMNPALVDAHNLNITIESVVEADGVVGALFSNTQ